MNKIPLFEEYRLIERTELEINGAWRGIIASLPYNFRHGSNTHHTNSSSVKKRLRKWKLEPFIWFRKVQLRGRNKLTGKSRQKIIFNSGI